MLFNKPMVLHSKQADGRHWLTTIDMPPLQIWPVAENHCRVGHFLATLISAKLGSLKSDIPEEMTLTRADVTSVASLSGHYLELKAEAGDVRIRLVAMKGPEGLKMSRSRTMIHRNSLLLSRPSIGQETMISGLSALVEVSEWMFQSQAMKRATKRLWPMRLSNCSSGCRRYNSAFWRGWTVLNLGFKVGLTTRKGGKEYVWVRPTDWNDEKTVICVLESQPRDCKGYKLGQKLSLPVGELLDYAIGSESAALLSRGLRNG